MSDSRSYRLVDIDMLRGLAIVVMALDHVRDYFMLGAELDPLSDPNVGPGLYFTRWITHFCAPVFVLLAGTSAGLMTARRSPTELGRFLLLRGSWLIAIEICIVSTGWSFAPQGLEELRGLVLIPMQVIWAIGASMVVLAGAQFLGRRSCLVVGIVALITHNLLDSFWPVLGVLQEGGAWWVPLHAQAAYAIGPFLFAFVYPLIPWAALMMVGYGGAGLFEAEPERRRRLLILWGLALTVAFVVIRLAGFYGDPNPWQLQATLTQTKFDFLNVTKYPPSLLFLLMTIGPALLLCAFAARMPVALRDPLVTFGRAPFAFYVAHIYLIHALCLCLAAYQGFGVKKFLTVVFFLPKGYGVGLPAVYLIWIGVVIALYPLSKWVAGLKARRRDWWLSYL